MEMNEKKINMKCLSASSALHYKRFFPHNLFDFEVGFFFLSYCIPFAEHVVGAAV